MSRCDAGGDAVALGVDDCSGGCSPLEADLSWVEGVAVAGHLPTAEVGDAVVVAAQQDEVRLPSVLVSDGRRARTYLSS